MDYPVVAVLRGEQVVIDARGLRRVIHRRTKQVLAELLPPESAESFAIGYNAGGEAIAKVVRYLPANTASTA
jgi:hypothetical protein